MKKKAQRADSYANDMSLLNTDGVKQAAEQDLLRYAVIYISELEIHTLSTFLFFYKHNSCERWLN